MMLVSITLLLVAVLIAYLLLGGCVLGTLDFTKEAPSSPWLRLAIVVAWPIVMVLIGCYAWYVCLKALAYQIFRKEDT